MDGIAIKSESRKGAMVVTIAGRVDSVSAGGLEEALAGIAREDVNLVLDMRGVTYLSSAGVRVIVTALQSAQNAGGMLLLANVSEAVERVLDMVGLLHVLRSFRTVDEALGSL